MSGGGSPQTRLRKVRLLLWTVVALAIVGAAALSLVSRRRSSNEEPTTASQPSHFGGPFSLTASNGKPFLSSALVGKPYALYFGFTRCGDTCPVTLSRLVKLRREAASDEAMRIVFVTIDPAHDGPREVGQYATMFEAPIIGLTGSPATIEGVKKQFGIYAEPVPNASMGKEMQHTGIVLLFDRNGEFASTISPDESDADALEKLRKLTA